MNRKKIMAIAACLIAMAVKNGYAQQKAGAIDMKAYMAGCKQFYDDKIGKPFSPMEQWRCMDGRYVDLAKTNKSAVIYFGFASCDGCRPIMPVFDSLSKDKVYQDYDFVYLTFDDSATVMEELDKMKITDRRFSVVSLPVNYLRANARGYPTIFFTDKDKIVKAVYGTGALHGPMNRTAYWHGPLADIK